VLGAVVGGQVAVAEGDEGRGQPDRGLGDLARRTGLLGAQGAAERRGGEHRPDHTHVLERQPDRAQAQPHRRDQHEGLGQLQRPAQQRHAGRELGGEQGLRPRGHLDLAVAVARGDRP
jgi:hypothetical protein